MLVKSVNLGVAFVLELCMLGALGYWGSQVGNSLPLRISLVVGAPLLAAVIWTKLMAPLAQRRLTGTPYLLLKLIIFGGAILALASVGQVMLAILFATIAVINQILLFVWHQ